MSNSLRSWDGTFASHPHRFKDVVKHCKYCGKLLALRSNRDIERRNYCSHKCRAIGGARTEAFRASIEKYCSRCGKPFIANTYVRKYCSKKCCVAEAVLGYKRRRAASLEGFFKNLIRANHRRSHLDYKFLIEIYKKQKGKCAVSGIEMTMLVGHGHVRTNVSIDRIDSSRGYEPDNVHLVCHIINLMKHNMTLNELVNWCHRIIRNKKGIK